MSRRNRGEEREVFDAAKAAAGVLVDALVATGVAPAVAVASVVAQVGPAPTYRIVRFVKTVVLFDVVHRREMQCLEARSTDFAIEETERGVRIVGHGNDELVPWANVRSVGTRPMREGA